MESEKEIEIAKDPRSRHAMDAGRKFLDRGNLLRMGSATIPGCRAQDYFVSALMDFQAMMSPSKDSLCFQSGLSFSHLPECSGVRHPFKALV